MLSTLKANGYQTSVAFSPPFPKWYLIGDANICHLPKLKTEDL